MIDTSNPHADTVFDAEQHRVLLTSSPLQRIGAYALAALAQVKTPDELTVERFESAVGKMTDHLKTTVTVNEATDPGGFWLSAGYGLWPNVDGLTHPSRKRKPQPARAALLEDWRTCPPVELWPGAPCAYCERAACGWFGKMDIPLGASIEHRNTTAPGHLGTPLCFACVACLWAFPYGCQLAGGRVAAVHSWDEQFLGRTVRLAVDRTLAAMVAGYSKAKLGPYARERMVLEQVRDYPARRITADVELMVLSNSNREQFLHTKLMSQPIARWLRTTRSSKPEHRAGYRTLLTAQASKDIDGEAWLAKRLFTDPAVVFYRSVNFVLERFSSRKAPPDEVAVLAPLLYSYCREVLNMETKDFDRVLALADRLASLLSKDNRPGPVQGFLHATRTTNDLYRWLKSEAISWQLTTPSNGAPTVLVSALDYRLLFEDEGWWSHRRLLVFAVLEALANRGWVPEGFEDQVIDMSEEARDAASEGEDQP
ncbi:hypothetical protein [Nocardia alni]|uniref:hypothetical protein n=1 Tax=Nocardia alni TaxID=2815723 RepID=UPI001C24B49E|nr:hypothetical protein [Nocardia alni]